MDEQETNISHEVGVAHTLAKQNLHRQPSLASSIAMVGQATRHGGRRSLKEHGRFKPERPQSTSLRQLEIGRKDPALKPEGIALLKPCGYKTSATK
jgi:hypothetical protein